MCTFLLVAGHETTMGLLSNGLLALLRNPAQWQALAAHPNLVKFYRLNPMERFIEAFRNTLYDGRWPTLSNTLFLVLVSAAAVIVGFVVFKRYEGRLAEEL